MSRRCTAVNGANLQSPKIKKSVLPSSHQLSEAAISTGQAQLLYQSRVAHAVPITGEPGFAYASRAADDQVQALSTDNYRLGIIDRLTSALQASKKEPFIQGER